MGFSVRAAASPSTAVVMMSGYPSIPDIPPHASFIRKPFSPDDLFAVVERTLARSLELRESLSQACEKAAELNADSKELQREIDEVGRAASENVGRSKRNRGRNRQS